MELNLNISLNLADVEAEQKETAERVSKAKEKKKLAKYEPKWEEVWITGYKTHTGKHKKGIFQTKVSDKDKERLLAVKGAIESGELQTGVESLSKFTKTKALGLWTELKEIRREAIIEEMVKNKPDNYILVDHNLAFGQMIYNLANEKMIAVDTETTGVEVFGADYVVGISFTLPEADKHYYIPVRHKVEDTQLNAELVFRKLKPFLESDCIRKIFHNAKFDIHMLRKEGIEVKGLYMDTYVAMHLLNENELSYALKNLATKYGRFFGFEDKSMTYEELFGKGGFENTPLDIGTVYACKDTHLTYKFAMWIVEQFERIPQLGELYFNIELPITEICIDMEKEGFLIDLEFAEQYKKELSEEVQALDERIKEGFGEININSNQQLQEVIYKDWGVQDDYKGKVDAQTLKKIVVHWERLIPQVAYIKDLLKYRELNKLLTTYIEPLPQKIYTDKRLHGSFNQCDTVTGRFASNNPNLQNLPYNARKMFIAPADKLIVGIDFSQIEPRFLSHITQDKDFMGAYVDGRDLYSEIASKTFKQPIEKCGDGSTWRKQAKVVLLGCMYGISAISLADTFGLTIAEAEQIYTDFYEAYPTMTAWFKATNKFADDFAFVQTAWGRKRRFIGHKEVVKKYMAIHSKMQRKIGKESFNIWEEYRAKKVTYPEARAYQDVSSNYMRVARQSINAIIQGSSADIMKIAMIEVQKYLKTKGEGWKMLGTIHDEVLIEIPATATAEEVLELAEVQRTAVTLSIPMKVDIEMSARWGCGVSFKEWKEAGCGRKVFEDGK